MENIDIKIKLLIFVCCLFLAILLVVAIKSAFFTDSPKKVSEKLQGITTINNLSELSAYKKESSDKDSSENIEKALSVINQSLSLKAGIIKYNQQEINRDFDAINKLLKDKKYKKTYEQTLTAIDKVNKALSEYKGKNKNDIEEIDAAIRANISIKVAIKNHRIYGDWATATLIPTTVKTDTVNPILKKENGKWQIVVKPTTYFDKEKLKALGVPDEIKKLNTSLKKDEMEPLVY